MKLNTFVRKYICSNTLIRLWIPTSGGGHRILCGYDNKNLDNVDAVCMEHELLSNKVWQSQYSLCEVVGVTDTVVRNSFYPEAVNIVIKPKEV